MNDIFTKFYSDYTKEIYKFLDSNSDILYINGYSGSGKSSVFRSAIKNYNKDVLLFHHLCFRGTSIDDFLLSFYDSFREHALKGKIILEKNPEEGFLQKVGFYFKNVNYQSVVVIDNFELVADDSAISDFLLYIAGFDNVKVVLISKNPNCILAENPTVSVERLTFDKISKDKFQEVMKSSYNDLTSSDIDKFYELTEGYELYIKMSVNYVESVNGSIKELLDEYEIKKEPFSDFIIDKQISLIPKNYYDILQNFAFITHNISTRLITKYSIGNENELPYLISKFAVSEFFETYYIKSYLRKYFSETLSLQDKISMFSKIKSIYETELSKSLKERTLRLSRETIRRKISEIENETPKVQKINSNPTFTYVAQAISGNPKWFVTDKNKKMNGLDELRRKRDERKEKEQRQKQDIEQNKNLKKEDESKFDEIIKAADDFEQNHEYKKAAEFLVNSLDLIKSVHEKIKLYSKIVKNYNKLNDNNLALMYLRDACNLSLDISDYDSYAKFRIIIGRIYKKMYAFSRAKTCLEEVINKKQLISEKTLANARVSLGEILELENNFNDALKEYSEAFKLVLDSDGDINKTLPEISYKIASILDENEEYEKAYDEYQKVIHYSNTSGNNKFLIKAFSNSGTILSYLGNTDEALVFLKRAYDLARESDNELDAYYTARSIASVYSGFNPEAAYEYLVFALEYAKNTNNSFETAISLLELGDYYYNMKQNEQALICYFQAKNILKDSASKENMERINQRINDMKVKLGDFLFNGMKALYEQN